MKELLLRASSLVSHPLPVNFNETDKDEFEAEKEYHGNNCYLRLFRDVLVFPESVIYKRGVVVSESLPGRESWKYYQINYLFKGILSGSKKATDKNKKYLLATNAWSCGHFHWFCDVLPKFFSGDIKPDDYVLLLPDQKYYKEIAIKTLESLGLSFQSVLWISEGQYYKVRELYFLSPVTSSGKMVPVIMQKIRDGLTKYQHRGEERIYISRKRAKFRKVVNEDELIALLHRYDFKIVYAEEMSFEEQLQLFNCTKTLLSIHGAGLTNCILMPPGGNVIEFRKKENGPFNVGYWHLATSLNHNYYYYNGTPDSEQPLVGRGCNLIIDINDFEKRVLKEIF